MSDRLKQISLRQFRERAAEIHEPMDIAIRDRDGNIQVIGYYTPYLTEIVGTGQIETVTLPPMRLDIPVDEEREPAGPRMIRTPQEAAAAVPQVHAFPKSAQTGRKKR